MSPVWWDFSDKFQPLIGDIRYRRAHRCGFYIMSPVNAEGGKYWMFFLSKLLFPKEIELFWLKLTLCQFWGCFLVFWFCFKENICFLLFYRHVPLKKLLRCSETRVLIWFLVPPAGLSRNYSQLPAAFDHKPGRKKGKVSCQLLCLESGWRQSQKLSHNKGAGDRTCMWVPMQIYWYRKGSDL